MKQEELDRWGEEFVAFHERFAGVFRRKEARQHAVKYLRGLLSESERKNGWQMAEAVGEPRADGLQRLLYRSQWEADAARDGLQDFIIEQFGEEEGIGVVDETGFLKKGSCSVGVKRQYSGTAGKVENCQVGAFLSYATGRGHVFLDRCLYLPEEIAYYLANAPSDMPLLKLAQIASTRFTVEQCIEEANGETGLDGYEVRYWHSWYRHITLAMMAHAWLAALRTQEKKRIATLLGRTDCPRNPPLARRGLALAPAFP